MTTKTTPAPGVGTASRRVHRQASGEALRFAMVGVLGYVLALAVFAVTVSAIGATAASVSAFVAALVHNFAWNRMWTFDAVHLPAVPQAIRFALLHGALLIVTLGVLQLLIALGMEPVAAQALAMLTVAVPSFLGHRLWSFGPR